MDGDKLISLVGVGKVYHYARADNFLLIFCY